MGGSLVGRSGENNTPVKELKMGQGGPPRTGTMQGQEEEMVDWYWFLGDCMSNELQGEHREDRAGCSFQEAQVLRCVQ